MWGCGSSTSYAGILCGYPMIVPLRKQGVLLACDIATAAYAFVVARILVIKQYIYMWLVLLFVSLHRQEE